jgi:PIN domain nuclease of toxin-antitoxin system
VRVVSLWEVAIKASIGELEAEPDLERWAASATEALAADLSAIEVADIAVVRTLPLHHRDPFDRTLVAQARRRGIPVISNDVALHAYDIEVGW